MIILVFVVLHCTIRLSTRKASKRLQTRRNKFLKIIELKNRELSPRTNARFDCSPLGSYLYLKKPVLNPMSLLQLLLNSVQAHIGMDGAVREEEPAPPIIEKNLKNIENLRAFTPQILNNQKGREEIMPYQPDISRFEQMSQHNNSSNSFVEEELAFADEEAQRQFLGSPVHNRLDLDKICIAGKKVGVSFFDEKESIDESGSEKKNGRKKSEYITDLEIEKK